MKIKIFPFALTLGISWGLIIFLSTLWLLVRDIYVNQTTFLGNIYPFYTVSISGSFIGLVYGFFDGLFLGLFFA